MSLADKLVFPQQHEVPTKIDAVTTYYATEVTGGTTLLEHYAGLAMQGFLASFAGADVRMPKPEAIAADAVAQARALIAELEKVQTP